MLLGRLRIRGKLAVLVAIPLLAVVVLPVPVVMDRVQRAQRAADTVDAVRVAGRVGAFVQDIELERMLGVGYLVGTVDEARFRRQATKVDGHAAQLAKDVAADGAKLPAATVAALARMRTLGVLRVTVLEHGTTAEKIISGYGTVAGALLDSLRLDLVVDLSTSTGRQVLALDTSMRFDEQITAGAAYLLAAAATKKREDLQPYLNTLAVLQTIGIRFAALATNAQVELYAQVQSELQKRLGSQFAISPDVNPLTSLTGLPLGTIYSALEAVVGPGRVVSDRIIADVIDQVNAQRHRALITAYLVGGVSLLVLLLAALLSAAVARSVVRPLTRLTKSVDRVARLTEEELTRVADDEAERTGPIRLDPVEVAERDEVGDLARAFERLQATAADLVERQATSRRNVAQMFGHVGRRTQNLVSRQIAIIDRLEADETDPGRLQRLYRLDHVSSRLRRNAGSLVVLSGATGDNEHLNPLPLVDVVRLALGEIEDYTRVDILVPEELSLVPAVVNDVVLVLAELMENATVFSPPHTRVVVSAQVSGGGVQLAVVDQGIGLTDEQLAQENARLRRRERLDLAPTGVLGLFVVGRLARRHGLRVELTPTPGTGLTATVYLPDRLLVGARPMAGKTPAGPPGSVPGEVPVAVPVPVPADAFGPVPSDMLGVVPSDMPGVVPAGSPGPAVDPSAETHLIPRIDVAAEAFPGSSPVAAAPLVPGASAEATMPLVPAVHASTGPVPPEMSEPGAGDSAFDAEAVTRASQSIAGGNSWSAFVPRQRRPTDGRAGEPEGFADPLGQTAGQVGAVPVVPVPTGGEPAGPSAAGPLPDAPPPAVSLPGALLPDAPSPAAPPPAALPGAAPPPAALPGAAPPPAALPGAVPPDAPLPAARGGTVPPGQGVPAVGSGDGAGDALAGVPASTMDITDRPTAIIPVVKDLPVQPPVDELDAGTGRAQTETQVLPVVDASRPAPLESPDRIPAPPGLEPRRPVAPQPLAAQPVAAQPVAREPVAPHPLAPPESLAPAPLPRPARAPLTRRKPGATLEGHPDLARPGPPVVASGSFDPDEARNLVEQFEAGVSRAMGEVGFPYQPEEG